MIECRITDAINDARLRNPPAQRQTRRRSHLRCAVACAVKGIGPGRCDELGVAVWPPWPPLPQPQNSPDRTKASSRRNFMVLIPNTQRHRKISSPRQSDLPQAQTADSNSKNAVSFSSARTFSHSPKSSRASCASASVTTQDDSYTHVAR
jgi:hypothetical protein